MKNAALIRLPGRFPFVLLAALLSIFPAGCADRSASTPPVSSVPAASAEALRKAPSAMNRQPWKISYAGQTLSFTPNKMDSVDAGIGVTHLECAAHAIPRAWRFSKDHKSLLMTCEETNEPV